jgi:hypothetical protein
MAYNGHRGPNVSEFIANLNSIPSAQDMANQNQDNFNLDDDLAMFTNTQFFDFDLGQDADLQPSTFDFNEQGRGVNTSTQVKGMDFIAGRFSQVISSVTRATTCSFFSYESVRMPVQAVSVWPRFFSSLPLRCNKPDRRSTGKAVQSVDKHYITPSS